MRRLILSAGMVMLSATLASAATLYLSVETDKDVYGLGETVNWTVFAWASTGDNAGVALLGVTLFEDRDELLSPAETTGGGPTFELLDTEYGVDEWFALQSPGTPNPAGGELADIVANQNPAFPLYDIGNDGSPHLFAKGSYVPTQLGDHTLRPSVTGANYWPDEAGSNAVAFETVSTTPKTFTVTPEPATLMLVGLGGIALLHRRRS